MKKPSRKSLLEESLFGEFQTHGLTLPVREFQFDPNRKWKFDLSWPQHRIAIEIAGGIFVGGRHSRGATMEMDFSKVNSAQRQGWVVFQFGPSQVRVKKKIPGPSIAFQFMYPIVAAMKQPIQQAR